MFDTLHYHSNDSAVATHTITRYPSCLTHYTIILMTVQSLHILLHVIHHVWHITGCGLFSLSTNPLAEPALTYIYVGINVFIGFCFQIYCVSVLDLLAMILNWYPTRLAICRPVLCSSVLGCGWVSSRLKPEVTVSISGTFLLFINGDYFSCILSRFIFKENSKYLHVCFRSDTVRSRYSEVNFLQIAHEWHPIARPLGIQIMMYILPCHCSVVCEVVLYWNAT